MVWDIQVTIKFKSNSDGLFTKPLRIEGEITIYAEKKAKKEEIIEKTSKILDLVKEVIE